MGNRRLFLERFLYLGAAGIVGARVDAQTPLKPLPAPAHATDVHHHIYDSRFPPDPSAILRPPDATAADYLLLQKRLGITRHVAVQPSTYGTDNTCLVDALHRFGDAARGIAVVNATVSNAELKRLDAAGVRGLRFNLVQSGATSPEMIDPLSKRIADLGWHIQVNASTGQILAGAGMWKRLPVPVVFDHFGHALDTRSAVFYLLCRLMQKGNAWTKLSGVETVSKLGPPEYSDGSMVAKGFIKEAPDRLLWGTNWPYATSASKPDDVLLFNLLAQWTQNEAMRTRILVNNPAQLFRFPR
ncbi:MAG TPA: amidohydrolase family protein [Bryobacteraceae bacterium]|nr:amidohydrolase family protein [Bryobacteraceae bacterium]